MSNYSEVWKDVVGFEGVYEVSESGDIKSVARVDARGNRRREKILSPCTNRGYFYVRLGDRSYSCHRLVATAFIPNPNNLPQVNHISGNKKNNHWTNLEWITAKDNVLHAVLNGLKKPPKHKTSDQNILIVAKLLSEGRHLSEVIVSTGLKQTVCGGVNNGTLGGEILRANGYTSFPINPIKSRHRCSGEVHHLAKSGTEQILTAASMLIEGHSYREVKKVTGLPLNRLYHLAMGRTWVELLKEHGMKFNK